MSTEKKYIRFDFEAHTNAHTTELELVSLDAMDDADGRHPLRIEDVSEAFNATPYPLFGFAYQGTFELEADFTSDDPVLCALSTFGLNQAKTFIACSASKKGSGNV